MNMLLSMQKSFSVFQNLFVWKVNTEFIIVDHDHLELTVLCRCRILYMLRCVHYSIPGTC